MPDFQKLDTTIPVAPLKLVVMDSLIREKPRRRFSNLPEDRIFI